MKQKILLTVFTLFFVVCVPVAAQTAVKKPTAVVVPFEAKSSGIEQDDCDIVTESFESEYARTGNAVVVNRGTLKKIQTEQEFQNSDWSNNDKTAKLGEALNAQQIVSGQLRFYNEQLFVIVQLQDIKTLAVLASVNTRVKDVMELLDKIPQISERITAQINGEVTDAFIWEKKWKVGEKGPGGGLVFYYSEAGFPVYESDNASPVICHYLECSPVELGSIKWCPCGNGKWCNVNTMDGVGAGKLNTKHILNSTHYNARFLTPSNCAAYACAHYFTGTTKEGEWYLPSRLELKLIYENLRKSGKIVSNAWHWSSSQYNSSNAWVQRFSDGNQGNNIYKYYDDCVRAVRAF